MFTHLSALVLIAVSFSLTSCSTPRRSEGPDSSETVVITDYGAHVLRESDEASVRAELESLLRRFADEDSEDSDDDRRRIPVELLYVDDAVMVPLRSLASEASTNALAAQYVLWFLGDKPDVAAMEARWPKSHRRLIPAGLVRKDLAEALRAVREELKLPVGHFRTSGLSFNRGMTKAYVQIEVGPGAFNCAGWGLMLHLVDSGWELVWSRFEWIS